MTVVLLALDESEASIEAARQAHRLFGSEVTYLALNVAESSPAWGPVPPVRGVVYAYPYGAPYPLVEEEILPARPEETLDAARETAHELADEAGVTAAPVGELGDPTTAILAAADEHDADVIVVGATEKGWWRRMIDGSVANDLVRESTRPVLIAGRAAE
jgi:nucleotide-binding universal stress UspA family protein